MGFLKAESHFVHPKLRRNNKCCNKTCLQKIKCQTQKAAMNLLSRNLKANNAILEKPACALRAGLYAGWELAFRPPTTAAD